MSGMSPMAHWLGNFLLDALILIVIEATICLALLNQHAVYMDEGRWKVLFTIFLMYTFAVMSHIYFIQMFFSTPETGVSVVIILNMIFSTYNSL